MLKPKKHITKKEIQKDPLLETIDQLQVKVEQNKQLYTKIIIGILAFIVLVTFLVRNDRVNNADADTALGLALISIDKGDYTTASFQLENVINDFESTNSADLAAYYLGKRKFDNNELDLAQKYIESYLDSKSSHILHTGASELLAEIHMINNNISSAIKVINNSLKVCDSPYDCTALKLKKALFSIEQGDMDIANQILEEILNVKDVEAGQKQTAEELMGRLIG